MSVPASRNPEEGQVTFGMLRRDQKSSRCSDIF